MASSLSNNSETGRGRHGWNSLDDYLWQHERRLDNFAGFVEYHTASYEVVPTKDPSLSLLRLNMEIICVGDIKLTVGKLAEVKERRIKRARTIKYSYHASSPNGNILRYDNAHPYPGHPTKHHKHVYNGTGRQVAGSPFHMGEDGWPNMHEVIDELMKMGIQAG